MVSFGKITSIRISITNLVKKLIDKSVGSIKDDEHISVIKLRRNVRF